MVSPARKLRVDVAGTGRSHGNTANQPSLSTSVTVMFITMMEENSTRNGVTVPGTSFCERWVAV